MNELIITVLSSSVIATIITAIFSMLSKKNDSKINNITLERKKWRDDIRQIAEELQSSNNYFEVLNIITKIKLRINSYGIGKKESYFKDSHIWETIENIEKCQADNFDEINIYKQQLIQFCSCLLKYDWERSKREVTGNNYMNFIILWGIACIVIYNTYTVLSHNHIVDVLPDCISGTIVLSLSIVLSIFTMNMFKLEDRTGVLQHKNKKAIHSRFANKLLELINEFIRIVEIFCIYFFLPLFSFIVLYTIIYILSRYIADFAGINFTIIALNLLMCFIVLEMFSLNKWYSDKDYVDTIETIKRLYSPSE